jgi:hypothetical protein
MKFNSSKFSYTISAFVFVAVLALLGGYLLGKYTAPQDTEEGFALAVCKVCGVQRPNCGCRPATSRSCNTCQMPRKKCSCEKQTKKTEKVQNAIMSLASNLPERCPPQAPCPVPDATKYVLKSTIPPCPPMPDMTRYMLKTECPSQPDMSKYVLKSSVPKCPPCISTCSKPCKIGECPPCPRPRCPEVNCPEPKPCPACPAVQVASCPEPNIQCKAQYEPTNNVRPMLASTASFGL